MATRCRYPAIVGILIGSLWAFSEVVFGAGLRTSLLPLRSTLLTGIGVGLLYAAFALTRRPWVVGLAVLTTVTAKVAFAPSFGFGITVINTSAAVLIEGASIVAVIYALQVCSVRKRWLIGLTAMVAVLCAGTTFYAIGSYLVPCAYLKSFNASAFLLRETLPWSLLSALTAPLGYTVGERWPAHSVTGRLPWPAMGTIAACWMACGASVLLAS